MPIISVEIMKIIDEREMQKKNKKKNKAKQKKQQKKNKQRQKEARGIGARAKVRELNDFAVHLTFAICKASLIFKSNLELALSIILKQRELYESKHVVVECRCLKNETCYPS